VDDAHEQVSHIGAIASLKEKRVFPMQYRVLQGSFAEVIAFITHLEN
jgi:hypothetical protein